MPQSTNPQGAYYQAPVANPTQGSAAASALGWYQNAQGGIVNTKTIGSTLPVNSTSNATATTPVITSQSAQNDLATKMAAWNVINNQIQSQGVAKANQAQLDAQSKAMKDVQDANARVTQQQLDQKQQEINTKNAALGLATSPSTSPANTPSNSGTTGANQTPSPTPTPTPAPAPSNSTQDSLNSATDTYTSGLQSVQSQKDALTTQTSSLLNSVLQGTIPLSAPQQALISSLQTQLNQNVATQQTANQAYTGAVSEAGFRAGGEYTPTQYAGQIASAVSLGVAKIQDLDNTAAKTVATLEQQFQTQNYDEINKNYDILMKQLDDKGTALKDMYSAVTSSLKDQRDYNLQVQDMDLKVKQFDLSATNSAIDNKLKTAQIAKVYQDMKNSDVSAAGDWVKNIQSGTAKLSDVPAGLKNAVAAGLANGNPQGVSAILDTTQKAVQSLNDYVSNNHGFTGAVGAKGVSSLFGILNSPVPGSSSADFDAKLKQVTNDVVLPNLTILHGLGRVTDREFQALQSSITSLSPNLSEEEFKTELGNITNMINSKVADANTHNGISLPSGTSASGNYNGISLPN